MFLGCCRSSARIVKLLSKYPPMFRQGPGSPSYYMDGLVDVKRGPLWGAWSSRLLNWKTP